MGRALLSTIGQTVDKRALKLIGFKVILAWHYLILFSPILIGPIESETIPFFFERQMTLYLSLAVAFASVVIVDKFILKKSEGLSSSIVLWIVGAVAALSTLFSVLLLPSPDTTLRLVVTVFLGFSEAYLMFFWLRFYRVAAGESLYRSFAFDMIIGAVLGFLVCVLQTPFSYGVIVALPFLATLSLFISWRTTGFPHKQATQRLVEPRVILPKGSLFRHFLKTILPTVVYAFVFGMLQGGYIAEGVPLMMAIDPIIILGISLCGIFLLLIPEDPNEHSDIDTIHRLSLVFFVLGIVGLSFFEVNMLGISETAILAGFNLFDFGAMILGIGVAKTLKLKGPTFLNSGRALTYLSLAAGFGIGFAAMQTALDDRQLILLTISGLSIIFLVATALTPFRKIGAVDHAMREALQNADDNQAEAQTDTGSDDKGARAQASPSTVKAASSGSKKEGDARTVPAVSGKQPTAEATHLPVPCEGCRIPDGSAVCPAQEKERNGGASKEKASQADDAGKSKKPKASKPSQGGTMAGIPGLDTPWRRVCHEIATLYRLSPRETEIFLLLAKGRNAEYIQQRLYISTHTAKTHIANIYRKLEVHSMQEMLDLIELFKEQGKADEKNVG